jgi:hypothetical protein
MEKKRNKKRPELKVLFDTSALYNKSASDLLNHQVSTVIREHSNHADLRVTWFLPEIVIHERQYQMENECLALLPSIKKLERLLGHNLNITEDILKTRIRETIDRQVAELNISVLPFDASQVE